MNALKPSRELSIEETLTLTFDLYSKNFTLFFIPALIAGAAEGAIGVLVRDFLSELLRTGLGGAGGSGLTWFWSILTPLLAISAVYVLVVCVISVLALGICVNLASERMEGKKPSLKGALVLTLDKLAPLAVVTIAVGVVVAFGLILLLVPGMIFAVMFSLVIL